jgi:hypothetical protein
MHARHLGDGVADRVIESTGGNLAAVNVGDRDIQQCRRHCCRQNFEAVAEDYHQVGRQRRKCLGKADHPDPGAARHGLGAVVIQLEVDLRRDRKAIGFDEAPRLAELCNQMHAADDDPQIDVVHLLQSGQDAAQQSVVRPRTGHHGNPAARCGHGGFSRHRETSSMPCSMT